MVGLEATAEWAFDRYGEAGQVALLDAGNRALNGRLFDPTTGRLQPGGVEAAQRFFEDPRMWEKLDPKDRIALVHLQGGFQTRILVDLLKQGNLVHERLEDNQKLLEKSKTLLEESVGAMRTIRDDVKTAGAAVATTSVAVKRESALTRRMLASKETAGTQLALADANYVEFTKGELEGLQRRAGYEALAGQARKVSLAAVALRQFKMSPEDEQRLRTVQVFAGGVEGLATAMATGGSFAVGLAAVNLLGGVRGLGGRTGPSPDARILKELREMRAEARQMHWAQMAQLDTIRQEIARTRDELTAQIIATRDAAVEGRDNSFAATKREFWRDCRAFLATAESNLRSSTLEWITPRVWQQELQKCDDQIGGIVGGRDNQVSADFTTPHYDPWSSGSARYEGASDQRIRRFIDGAGFGQMHGLWPDTARQRLVLDELGIAPTSIEAQWAQRPDPSLAVAGGIRQLSAGALADNGSLARHVLPLRSGLWVVDTTLRGMSPSEVRLCASQNKACRAADVKVAATSLQRLLVIGAWFLQQEDLKDGVTFAPRIGEILSDSIVPAYYHARRRASADSIAALLTRSSIPRQGEMRSNCNLGRLSRDALCIMQLNEPTARNSIISFVEKRLLQNFGNDMAKGIAAYRSALAWPSDTLLRLVLGSDVLVSRRQSWSSTGQAAWFIELPRVFEGGGSDSAKVAPPSCHTDLVDVARRNDPEDALIGVRFAADFRWARCYPLPPGEVFERPGGWIGPWYRGPGVLAALEELAAIRIALVELAQSPPDSSTLRGEGR